MSTNNFRRAMFQNSYLFEEAAKHGKFLNNTEHTRSQQPIFTKKKGIETKAREASERRYTRRSNICTKCNMTKPMGMKECENCE